MRSRTSPGGRRSAALAVLIAALAAACDLPRDAEGTIDRVRGGELRVGVIDHAPWTVVGPGEPLGVEVDLARELARSLGARPRWVARPAAELIEALAAHELDLVVGGLTGDAPWVDRVALTRPYYTDSIVVAAPAGTPPLPTLRGDTVAIEPGDAVAAKLRDGGAIPIVVADLRQARGPIAAPIRRLPELGRASGGPLLQETPHVLAVARGENAMLVAVERLLAERRASIPARLRAWRAVPEP